jgi:hypothetical protein
MSTCMCVPAPYQSVRSVDVYCRMCPKVVVPIHKVGWVRLLVVPRLIDPVGSTFECIGFPRCSFSVLFCMDVLV